YPRPVWCVHDTGYAMSSFLSASSQSSEAKGRAKPPGTPRAGAGRKGGPSRPAAAREGNVAKNEVKQALSLDKKDPALADRVLAGGRRRRPILSGTSAAPSGPAGTPAEGHPRPSSRRGPRRRPRRANLFRDRERGLDTG